jgi:aminoglycoside/choline kinase family phosphotransferase/GTP:adenosylcobinamide-phosphate guanylyltransferase
VADHRAFLGSAGWGDAACEPLTGDASARKYFRLRKQNRSAILMDASRVLDSVAPFIRIGEHLRQFGFSAPEIFSRDEAAGLLLLEDFGDATFAQLLEKRSCDAPSQNVSATPPSRDLDSRAITGDGASPAPTATRASQLRAAEELFALATDFLVALHRHPRAVPENQRPYSPEQMLADLELFLEWRTPDISAAAKEEFRDAWRAALPLAHRVPETLLLRDYHVANLMLLPERAGVRQAGLLDFQDAYRGPVTYDLVSLLEDARRDVPDDLREKMLSRYAAQFPALDKNVFETSLAVLAALRHTRVIAIFERLARRDGRTEYRRLHSPRVEGLLQRALRHPALDAVKHWMNRHATLVQRSCDAPSQSVTATPSPAATKASQPLRIITAMLLAAGYGTRLAPLTDRTPKPLVPVAGRPMIEYALDKLRAYGIGQIVINVSHLKEQLKEYFDAPILRKFPLVQISEEAEPLETGGGLKKAAPFLGDEPVFVINSDILWTDDGETALNRLARHWDGAKMDFLLLAQSKSRAVGHDQGEDHLFVTPENTIGWSAADAPYIIAGVGIFHPRVLTGAPDGKFSVKILWRRAMEQYRLFCLPHHGRWFQTGTIPDIRKTEKELQKRG